MPTYGFWTPCALCPEGNVHVVNEYDQDYGDSGTPNITGGLYGPKCDLAPCP